MNNIVLYQPEIPGNTGNIMRTCVATNTKLHLIKPLGFSLDESHLKRSAVNYIENLNYEVYEKMKILDQKTKEHITILQDMVKSLILHLITLILKKIYT